MGQYYRVVFLSDTKYKKEIIRIWLFPRDYENGSKLTEHSYIGNKLVNAVEQLLSPSGMFYKSRIVWAGDYADTEEETRQNLYHMVDESKPFYVSPYVSPYVSQYVSQYVLPTNNNYKYFINHTKKEYVDKIKINDLMSHDGLIINPLPLLVSEGNGRGSGDYKGPDEEMCGRWSRDIISVEDNYPDDYNEITPRFIEL
jgi:hypothetical protein